MLDDAHGLGVLGPQGGGAALAAGLSAEQAPIYMGTLGKAMGCYGAFVAGSDTVIDAHGAVCSQLHLYHCHPACRSRSRLGVGKAINARSLASERTFSSLIQLFRELKPKPWGCRSWQATRRFSPCNDWRRR
jgi:7-keto-8-aminopelargonate synthetase-like enzyme